MELEASSSVVMGGAEGEGGVGFGLDVEVGSGLEGDMNAPDVVEFPQTPELDEVECSRILATKRESRGGAGRRARRERHSLSPPSSTSHKGAIPVSLGVPRPYPLQRKGSGIYRVHQPSYKCNKLRDDEFKRVRSAFGVSEREYYAAFGLQEKRTESDLFVIGAKDAAGKSKSFFYLSPDQRFILKSCTDKDVKTLLGIVRRYRKHAEDCCETSDGSAGSSYNVSRGSSLQRSFQDSLSNIDINPRRKVSTFSCQATSVRTRRFISQTLLPRYLGLYRLEFFHDDTDDNSRPALEPVTMVAMTNFFGGVYPIHRKFDLKGSTHARTASERERAKKSPVFKDLDWMEERRRLRFWTRGEMERVRQQLDRDTAFLSDCNLIDYSLLVGVHEIDRSQLDTYQYRKTEATNVVSVRSDDTISYYGLVDILTPYGQRKRRETFFLGTMLLRDISAQPPSVYRSRFMAFCETEILESDDDRVTQRQRQEDKTKQLQKTLGESAQQVWDDLTIAPTESDEDEIPDDCFIHEQQTEDCRDDCLPPVCLSPEEVVDCDDDKVERYCVDFADMMDSCWSICPQMEVRQAAI